MGPGRLLAVLVAAVALAQTADPYAGLPDPRPVAVLKEIGGRPGRGDVSPPEGRYLHDLIIKHDLKAGLEIGTSNGCSGIWLGMAFSRTGGRLVTVDDSQIRGREARAAFERAGLADRVELLPDDPLNAIPKLMGPFDFVFIDTRESHYNQFLKMILPKLRPGGFVAAHDVNSRRSQMSDFIRSITADPRLKTEFVPLSRAGLSISRKQ
jgi:predicted O-methyltransferase YrrM